MNQLTFYFDVISPYACLAFHRLPQVLQGFSYSVRYQPVLLAGLLKHFGQKGPAEIEPKRAWTFRHVAWLAHQHGLTLHPPTVHPFNPLSLLRLAVATTDLSSGETPNRWVCEQLFNHVWGAVDADPHQPERLAQLTGSLAHAMQQRGRTLADPNSPAVKEALQRATAEAIQKGVFGVPHVEHEGRLYFGLEGLDLLAAALRGDPWFAADAWHQHGVARPGVTRR